MSNRMLCRRSVLLLAACLACGKASPSKPDAGPRDAGSDVARDVPVADVPAVSESVDAFDGASAMDAVPDVVGEGSGDGSADVALEAPAVDAPADSTDADDPRCANLPGAGACTCDGFVMPNPAGANLPNPARYEASDGGVVVDDVTGLWWEAAASPSGMFTEPKAVEHCDALVLAGQSDWRVPSIFELVSLVDFTSKTSATPAAFAPPQPLSSWSSTLEANNFTGLSVEFKATAAETGLVNSIDPMPVMCVRTGGAPLPRCYRGDARYTLDSTDVATDLATGLAWRRHNQPNRTDWNTAKTSCAALGGGWRLPSIHELQTIVEHARARATPQIDPTTFPGTQIITNPDTSTISPFWTSSPDALDPTGQAWQVDFAGGYTGKVPVATLGWARCVR
jgi:hypothetical protein